MPVFASAHGWAYGLVAACLFTMALPHAAAASAAGSESLPPGFVVVRQVVPGVIEDMRYAGTRNFIGDPIRGYEAAHCILSVPAARALKHVQERAAAFGLNLKLFDCYRPQRAVDHFVQWAKDLSDQRQKATYYPDVPKEQLFAEGYIAERSGHSRGSTVDLTLVDATSGEALDMGTPFDYFGPESWPSNMDLPAPVRANRLLLQELMENAGFVHYPEEWWHFTLANEPFPETYFDFVVR